MQWGNKKGVQLALASVMVLTLLAGCTKDKGSNEPSSNSASKSENTTANATQETTQEGSQDPAANFQELKITMLGDMQTGTSKPTEDVLTPIWREKTKVIPEIVQIPPGMDRAQWFQNQIVGDTLPDILAVNGIFSVTQLRSMLIEGKHIREISKDDINKYMPRTVAYLKELGVTVDQYYEDNLVDGKLWYIPSGNDTSTLDAMAFPNIRDAVSEKNPPPTEPYAVYLRDDILKKIFPQVKTEKELKDLYVSNGGKLSFEEANDIPINSQADMLAFLHKVKDLNLKVGNKQVIPGHLSFNNTVDSLLWSNYTTAGFWWTNFANNVANGEQINYAPLTSQWKDYIKFYNTLYNEQLIDKENFIQKDEQRNAKIINGEYAVFNAWGPVADARALSDKENRGYGFRRLILFPQSPMTGEFQNAAIAPNSINGSGMGVGISSKITDEELPQILNWIDWNQSKEANELREWGLPEWSTGTGKDRRFKPEFKDIENWILYQKEGEKDGPHYGLYLQNNTHAAWNAETYQIAGLPYAEGPIYTYPTVADVNTVNIDMVTQVVNRQHFASNVTYYRKIGWTEADLDPESKLGNLSKSNGWESDSGRSTIVKAIVGKPEDFDKNYDAYLGTYSQEWKDAFGELQSKYKSIYDQFIKPELDKVK